jgi:integrase
MREARYRSPKASGRPHRKTVAPRVREQHSRTCVLSTGSGKRCSCRPSYVASLRKGGRALERSFPTLAEAVAWAEATHDALRRGQLPELPREQAPPLQDLAVSFLHRARRGEALTRSRQRYAQATLDGYEVALRLRVLAHVDPRNGLCLAELPADAIDARTAQGLVDAIAARESGARARAAAAALASVLRDGYLRGLVDELPPRLLLPPPPRPKTLALTVAQADRLVAAAQADDHARRRSLLGPLVALLLGSGCRVSEALGLVWGTEGLDLASEPPLVHVQRETTKTEAGARTVPLDAQTTAVLRRHRLACGRPADGAPVFPDQDGQPLARWGRVRFGLKRVAAAAGLADVSAHTLRHTHATWLASAGVPAPVAAARLGHADGGALFMRVYAHPGASEGETALRASEAFRSRASVI